MLAWTGLAFFLCVVVGDGVAICEGTIVSVGVGVRVGIRVGIRIGIRVGIRGSGVWVGGGIMTCVCWVSTTGAVYVLPVVPPDEPPPP